MKVANSIGEFVELLESQGELRRVRAPVDPYLEMTEIIDRLSKPVQGAPGAAAHRADPLREDASNVAVLFEKVQGHEMPALMNAFGSQRRMGLALGVERLEEIADRLQGLMSMQPPESLRDKLAFLGKLKELASFPPKLVKAGPAQEVCLEGESATLQDLPVITCWPQDAGPFITMPIVITRDPTTGRLNAGMYRMQVYDERTAGLHWHRHKPAARHYEAAKALGAPLPVAVALGADPATVYAATAPLPPFLDEFLFSGFLRKRPVEMVKTKSIDLVAPAQAEIILEGYADTGEDLRLEGPFGDHTGYYSEADHYPAFHLTAVTRRSKPIYLTTVVGQPPMEDYWLGYATERIFLPLARMFLPDIVDYHMPPEGVFHNLVFVSINKRYPGHAYSIMNGLWGMGMMALAKVIVVVDADVNVQNVQEAWWTALANIDPERDVRFSPGPTDPLDHASRSFTFGSKMGIDATRKWPEEGHHRGWPDKITMSKEIVDKVSRRWAEYGLA